MKLTHRIFSWLRPKTFSNERNQGIQEELNKIVHRKTLAVKILKNTDIKPEKRTAELDLFLIGESQPIRVKIGKYKLTDINKEGRTFIELNEIETAKDWLTILIREHLQREGGRVELPPGAHKKLRDAGV